MDKVISSRINIETDDDGVTVYARIYSDVEPIEFSEDMLQQAMAAHGFSGLEVSDVAQKEVCELLAENHSGNVKLGKKANAKVEVIVSGDLLSATLQITAEKGGLGVTTKQITSALDDKEIDHQLINKNRIVGLVKKSRLIEPGETIEVVVAKGIPPKHGKDTQFKCLLSNATDRKPHERQDGSLDYYDLGEIVCVDEGCELMRKFSPEPARIGRTVTGQDIPARIGKTLHFKKCKGASVSPIDQDLLIASIKGQPIIAERGINIDRVLTVKNVDLHTGHINYDGTVVVKGDVASTMKIKVTGDVQIFGLVENACIESEGNIDIKLGAIGHATDTKDNNCMQINCQGNLTAGYLENAQIDVQGDVIIKSRVSNCTLQASHQLIVGNQRQEKSGIVGGQVSAGQLIRTETLGSSGAAITHVAIACSPELLEQLESIKQRIVNQDQLLISKLGNMVALSKKRTEKDNQQLEALKTETDEQKAGINALINQKSEVESILERAGKGRVIVKKEAFPGVTIKILDQEKSIKSRFSAGTFLLSEGAITHNSSVK